MPEAYEAIVSGVSEEEFNMGANGSDNGARERLAVATATTALLEHVPDADIWRVDAYDGGAGIGFNFDTEGIDPDDLLENMDELETIEELAVTFD